jgi:hypothetical protein
MYAFGSRVCQSFRTSGHGGRLMGRARVRVRRMCLLKSKYFLVSDSESVFAYYLSRRFQRACNWRFRSFGIRVRKHASVVFRSVCSPIS